MGARGTTPSFSRTRFSISKAIAGRSRRFNFSTDAGHRFERGVDPGRTVEIIERITALVQSICCGGEAGARRALEILVDEIRRAMKLCGTPTIQAIDSSLLGSARSRLTCRRRAADNPRFLTTRQAHGIPS